MRYSVLASGSTGNSFFIGTEETRLLVDVGLSAKKIENLLKQIGEHPDRLTGILITHEHSDHIRGLGVLARRYNLPIYCNQATWRELERMIGEIDSSQVHFFQTGERHRFGDLIVESFGISHDAAEPMGFIFHHNEKKLSFVTDLGYVSDKIKSVIYNSDVFIMEANHDVAMLRMSSYPWSIKRRILGDSGHLSNESSAEALIDVVGPSTERVYLAHLSKENNMIDLARMTVTQILGEAGVPVGTRIGIYDTYPEQPTSLASL
jgi:phosphoribosyl 1,2-cyclic phosphodiesterase